MRVVAELSNWPLVRLLSCLDVRESLASILLATKQGQAGSDSSRRSGLDLFFPTAWMI